MKVFCFLCTIFLLSATNCLAQTGIIRGIIRDKENQPVPQVKISIDGKEFLSDDKGSFRFELPEGKYKVIFRREKYFTDSTEFRCSDGLTSKYDVVLIRKDVETSGVIITEESNRTKIQVKEFFELFPIDPKKINEIPTIKSDIESRLVTMAGVATNNEFSSQYRVRGGNFDENLIYVNDIEIYRPQLVRSGQQEGLGFTNANLAKEVSFSTGGFEARYGDKMSSVLNVTYKTPTEFAGTAELGILTANLHIEGASKSKKDESRNGRFTYLIGARRFATRYLLQSLETQGDYRPEFYDFQSLVTWSPNKQYREPIYRERNGKIDTVYQPDEKLKISLFTAIARNEYLFQPQNRETTFGTIQRAFRLFVAFEGQERTNYLTGQTALLVEQRPRYNLNLKYILSAFQSRESELFDIEGGYRLADVNTSLGSDEFNEIIFVRGIGTYLNHARNYLIASVFAAEHRGEWYAKNNRNKLFWGIRLQREMIDDELKEWSGIDSADYFRINEVYTSRNLLQSNRISGYLQDTWKLLPNGLLRMNVGTRLNYWTLNQQLLVSPRLQLIFDPSQKDSTKQYQIRIAAGLYQQPPFYREMRFFDGSVNTNLKAQSSWHFILGGDYIFRIWGRPYKTFLEAYYKAMDNLIPYEVDNVRIRYYAQNLAKGYAYGVDFKVNGEFIRGVDSWLSISYLKTMESWSNNNRGYIPRPTDQRLTIGMYFQDELPFNPTFKVHINFVYGSGLPFGPPQSIEARNTFRAPAYRRVDLGFSKSIFFRTKAEKKKYAPESLWISAEIFNLFGTLNTVSYLWIQDVYQTQFAIPNYLSARLINIRMIARF